MFNMKHFNWMVIEDITREGIIFRGTLTNDIYIFYWNPIRVIKTLLYTNDWSFGWFPLTTKHINWK